MEKDPFVTKGLPTSVGPINSPAFLYLMAIPLLLSKDPTWATGFIALLDTLAVAGCYLLARRWFGRWPALIASLLFALNPWAVIFSRKVWQSNSLPIFTTALLICLLLYQKGRRPWWGAVALFVWALEIQVHISTIALLPVVLFALLSGLNLANLRRLAVGAALFLATFAPVVYGDAREGWSSLRGALTAGQQASAFDLTALGLARELLAGPGYPSLTGEAYPQFAPLIVQLPWIGAVTLALIVIGSLYLVASPLWRRSISGSNWNRLVIGLATVAPPVVFLYHPFPLHIHYFVQLWPAAFIAAGVLLDDSISWLASRLAGRRTAVMTAGWTVVAMWLLLLGVTQLKDYSTFLEFIRRYPTPGGYGLTVGEAKTIADTVRANQPAGDVYLVSQDLDLAEALSYLLRGSHYLLGSESANPVTLATNVQPSALLLQLSDHQPVQAAVADLAPLRSAQSSYQRGSKELSFFTVSRERMRQLCPPASPPATTFDGQVSFEGIRIEQPTAKTLIVVSCWQVLRRPADLPDQLSVFNHLVDGNGNRLAQADGIGHQPAQWRDGDFVVNYYLLTLPADLPAGDYYLLTGFYRLDNGQRIPVEQAGQVTDHLRTGPFQRR